MKPAKHIASATLSAREILESTPIDTDHLLLDVVNRVAAVNAVCPPAAAVAAAMLNRSEGLSDSEFARNLRRTALFLSIFEMGDVDDINRLVGGDE
jgi:hypothetical protein